MADGAVTGSCEQCGERYALLVPEPGSGDLDMAPMTALFGWCSECGRLVGRRCCWGPELTCARCAADRAADAEDGFAILGAARAAVRRLDATAAGFAAVEQQIAATRDSRAATAAEAWEPSWLTAATLRARIDGGREAARSRLEAVPPHDAERASELREELRTVDAYLDVRWRAVEDALSEAGMRLAVRSPRRWRAKAGTFGGSSPPVAAAPRSSASPTASAGAVAVATAIPILEPDRAVIDVAVAVGAVRTPAVSPTPPGVAAPAVRTSGAPSHRVAPAPPPARGRSLPSPDRATAPNAAVVAAATQAPPRLRRPGLVASLLVAVAAVGLAVAIIAVGRQADGGAPGIPASTDGRANGAAPTIAVGIAPTPSPSPSMVESSLPSPAVLTVDEHRMGLLEADDPRVTRVIGGPEVEAFPSPFDRSLRLGGRSAGLCVASPMRDASTLALELHLGKLGAGGGRLVASFDGDAAGLELDLASLATLEPGAWYGLRITAEGSTGRAVVTSVVDGRPLVELELTSATSSVLARAGEVCIHVELPEIGAAVFVDSLRIDG